PKLEVLADSSAGNERTLRVRVTPQRPVRLASLHVDAGAIVEYAVVNGRRVPGGRTTDGRPWGFGVVFHAPPPEGIEITLVIRAHDDLRLRAMDASDGLDGLPGFRPRPPDVGIVGSHSSEMLAVARTYPV
ncbi:peptidase, partial [Micromonospora azadirachtae]